jgi:enoyl-CoA hydratase/carnithine racemase
VNMTNKLVLYEKRDHVGYITLNNPQDGNRVNSVMTQELVEVGSEINGDPEVYLAVITGSGEFFCAGGEIRHVEVSGAGEEIPAGISAGAAIAGIDRPTLAALNGDAIGEGLELAISCDLRISSDKARFGLPQITEGRIPVDGGTQRLSRIVGKGKALEMVLTGQVIDVREAFEIGLVNKVVSQDSLKTEVESMASNLASKAPLATRYAKEAVNKGLDLTLEQGLRLEADLYFLLHTTGDRTEGIQSFLQKRKPEYKGR